MAYKFDAFGCRKFGDDESLTTGMAWVWYAHKEYWMPKFCDRFFPSPEALVVRAEELGTVAIASDLGDPMPTHTPEGDFDGDDYRVAMPWAETPAPGDITYQ